MESTIVIKLGGSLLSKSETEVFDYGYLSGLKEVLTEASLQENKFFIAVGGGYTMRKYRDLARKAGVVDDMSIHWVGTTVNVLHAYLVNAYFAQLADEDVIKYEDYYEGDKEKFMIDRKIKVGGGGRPGHSGDVDAILASDMLNSKIIVSLKNVDGVYDADPKLNPKAKRLSKISWREYLDIIGNKDKHEPGGNYPIDPIASRMAMERKLKFVILGGDDLENFGKYLKGQEYVGTEVT